MQLLWRSWWRSQQLAPFLKSRSPSCCYPRKHASCYPLPYPVPSCLFFVPILCPAGWELAAVSPSMHLLRPLWPGGLPGPRLQACSQGHPSRCLAAGVGRQQSEPYHHSSLRWTVVAAGAGVDQLPDTQSRTSGGKFRRHLQLSWKAKIINKKISTSPFFPSFFPQAFFSLSFLEKLDLSWNLLTSLPVDFSASLSALRELRLQHNSLQQLTGYR